MYRPCIHAFSPQNLLFCATVPAAAAGLRRRVCRDLLLGRTTSTLQAITEHCLCKRMTFAYEYNGDGAPPGYIRWASEQCATCRTAQTL